MTESDAAENSADEADAGGKGELEEIRKRIVRYGPGPTHTPDIDWIALRAEYETGAETVNSLLARYGISTTALYTRIAQEKWRMRADGPPVTRRFLVTRLFRMIEKQIKAIENKPQAELGEAESRQLGNLTRTLDKLIEIDDADDAARRSAFPGEDMAALRKKVLDRLAEIAGD